MVSIVILTGCGPAGTIAYISPADDARHLMLLDVATGETRQVAAGRVVEVAWSPEGERLAFTRSDSDAGRVSLFVLDVASGEERLLRADVGRRIDVSWSPDGSQLLYVAQNGADRNLMLIQAAPPYTVRALTDDGLTYNRPSWSPDGGQVAFLSRQPNLNSALEVLDVASGERRELLNSQLYKRSPTWSPDGTRIALIVNRAVVTVAPEDGTRFEVAIAPMDTIREVHWSPDGQVLYYSNVPSVGKTTVWAVTRDASVRHELARMENPFAGLSPDGRYLLTMDDLCILNLSRFNAVPECLGVEGHHSFGPAWGP